MLEFCVCFFGSLSYTSWAISLLRRGWACSELQGREDYDGTLQWGYRDVVGLASASLLSALWARVSPCPKDW
eukprot:4145937-Amphidinium_carterae.1